MAQAIPGYHQATGPCHQKHGSIFVSRLCSSQTHDGCCRVSRSATISSGSRHCPCTAGHRGPRTHIPQGVAKPSCELQAQMQPRFPGGGGRLPTKQFCFPEAQAGRGTHVTPKEAIKTSPGRSTSPGPNLLRASRLHEVQTQTRSSFACHKEHRP